MRPPLSRTLPDLLRENAQTNPETAAIKTTDGDITFGELDYKARSLAAVIRQYGISRGERVGLLASNSIAWVEILFAASAAGAVVVPFSTWSTASELDFLIRDSEIRLLFAASKMGNRSFTADVATLSAAKDLPIVAVGENAEVGLLAGHEPYESLFDKMPDITLVPGDGPSAGDDAVVLYTSGSTSHPKAVRLQQHALIENGFNIGERQGINAGETVFLPTPLFWSYGVVNALPAAFTHAAGLVLMERFEPAGALDLIEGSGCTSIYTLPSITAALLQCDAFSLARTKSLRAGMTIGTRQDFLQAADRLGIPELCNVYGATETYGNCAVTDHSWPKERRARSQGEPLPGQTMRFRDPENGRELPRGEVGLLEVKGYVTPGYTGFSVGLNDKIFTEDGFYRTGDLGYLDNDGGFVFVARDTDMIKRNGINVSPAEVEEVLCNLDGISAVAVVGAPDEQHGEAIIAFVVGDETGCPTVDEIVSHCRSVMSKYKIPDHIELCTGLPLTATGKLQRNALKEKASELVGQQATEAKTP